MKKRGGALAARAAARRGRGRAGAGRGGVDGSRTKEAEFLIKAAIVGDPTALKSLLASGADPNAKDARGRTALWWAAAHGHGDIVRALHAHGACVDAVDADGVPPVYISASEGRVPLVRLLLELGSQAVGTPCSNGTSAVHAAAANGSVELLQLLHESGARLDAPDGAGVTPAQLAEREGNTVAAQLLRSVSVPGE